MDNVQQNGVPDRLARASTQTTTGCGMWILLLSLSILFFASIVGYLFIHFFRQPVPLSGFPHPGGLWLSTLILIASSGTLHWALGAAKRDNKPQIQLAMNITLALATLFLTMQAINWAQLRTALQGFEVTETTAQALRFYTVSFYFLTVLHAAHVVGGFIPMIAVTVASYRGFYTRTSHNGLRLLGMYWHFLDVVWLVLFAVLLSTL